MPAQGQVDPEVQSWLLENVMDRVKVMCLSQEYYPGNARIGNWADKAIDQFVENYLEVRLEAVMRDYSEDEMLDRDKMDELKSDARLGLIGHYFDLS
jgi:hypothetical protein